MRGQVKSNTRFQTEGRCRPLSRFMELLLFLILMASISSLFPVFLHWLHNPSFLPSNQCCVGSLLRGPQCHCWGLSSVRPVCALPYGVSGFSLIPLCTHSHSCYRGSGTRPLSSCRQGDMTSHSSGFASGCMLRWRWSGCPEEQGSSPTFHLSLAHRGCARSSVALPAGSPLLVEGERTVLEELGGSLLLVLGEIH